VDAELYEKSSRRPWKQKDVLVTKIPKKWDKKLNSIFHKYAAEKMITVSTVTIMLRHLPFDSGKLFCANKFKSLNLIYDLPLQLTNLQRPSYNTLK
jgi:hypothetical protein